MSLTDLSNSVGAIGTATVNKNHQIEGTVTAEATARSAADAAETLRAEQQEAALALGLAGAANVKVGRFVGSAAELAAEQAAVPSQATVFSSWARFSHNATLTFPAVASETTAWAYNSTTGQIYDTVNSTTLIGVVSPEKYSDYVLDVSVRSTDSDDDVIGILLAWYKDPTTGYEYTLTALRSPGGGNPLWGVVYNCAQGTPGGQKTVKDGSATVNWGNGASGALSATAAGFVTNTSTTGWSGQATQYGTDGHTRILAVRNGNTITLTTSNFSAPDTMLSSTQLVIDLTSDPVLAKFQGASSYGFVSYSQANAYWAVNQFTNTQDTIFNLATGVAYQNLNGVWSTTTAVSWSNIPANCFLVNPDTGKIFFVKDQNNVLEFNAPQLLANGTLNNTGVQNKVGNYRGIGSQYQSGTISGDYWGYIYITAPVANVTAAFTTTLDVSNVTEDAPKIAFLNNSNYPWTIQLSNGGGINSSQAVGATKTLVLAPFTVAECWYSAGGGVLWVMTGPYADGGPGKTTVSSAAPSGGSNGDTWYQV